jgi:hypothetical protein
VKNAKTDTNQKEIVAALRKIGASVESLHRVGGGVPDLLVGYRGENYLMEVKDGQKPPSERRLNTDQVEWHDKWRGQRCVVLSPESAILALRDSLR